MTKAKAKAKAVAGARRAPLPRKAKKVLMELTECTELTGGNQSGDKKESYPTNVSPPSVNSVHSVKNSPPKKRTASEAMLDYWKKVRSGEIPDERKKERHPRGSVNPLLDLSEELRCMLFTWLRECPFTAPVLNMLAENGVPGITRDQLDDFFESEVDNQWETRIERAAIEANALVRLAEKSRGNFSAAILAALGQETFRQISSGQMQPESVSKIGSLFLRARSDDRADQMQELKREKVRHEMENHLDHALDKLSEEVEQHPAAKEAFEALRRELAEHSGENK